MLKATCRCVTFRLNLFFSWDDGKQLCLDLVSGSAMAEVTKLEGSGKALSDPGWIAIIEQIFRARAFGWASCEDSLAVHKNWLKALNSFFFSFSFLKYNKAVANRTIWCLIYSAFSFFDTCFFFWWRTVWKRKWRTNRSASSMCLMIGPPRAMHSAQAIINFSWC